MEKTPAGWYSDPWNGRRLRYWNGQEWTLHTGRAPGSATQARPRHEARWTAAALLLVAAVFMALVVQPLLLTR